MGFNSAFKGLSSVY